MDKKELIRLKKKGYTYLVRVKNLNAFRPLKGSLQNAIKTGDKNDFENEVILISEAIKLAEGGFEYEESICSE